MKFVSKVATDKVCQDLQLSLKCYNLLMSSQKISHDSETPAKEQQVITACALIHKKFNGKHKVFLPKRADTKKFLPGIYETPGGHIDFGENIKEGLKREVFEEFGVNINVGDPFYAFTYHNDIKGSHSVEILFFATFVDSIDNIAINPEDHSGYDWFAEEELDKIVNDGKDDPEIKAFQKAFKLLKGSKLNFG